MRTPEKMSDPTTESLCAARSSRPRPLPASLAPEEEQALAEYSSPVTLSLPEPAPPVLPEGHTSLTDAEQIARLRRLAVEKGHTNLRFALAESGTQPAARRRPKEINAEPRTKLQTSHSAEPPAPAIVPDQTPTASRRIS